MNKRRLLRRYFHRSKNTEKVGFATDFRSREQNHFTMGSGQVPLQALNMAISKSYRLPPGCQQELLIALSPLWQADYIGSLNGVPDVDGMLSEFQPQVA